MNRKAAIFAAYQALGWKVFEQTSGERRGRLLIYLAGRYEREAARAS